MSPGVSRPERQGTSVWTWSPPWLGREWGGERAVLGAGSNMDGSGIRNKKQLFQSHIHCCLCLETQENNNKKSKKGNYVTDIRSVFKAEQFFASSKQKLKKKPLLQFLNYPWKHLNIFYRKVQNESEFVSTKWENIFPQYNRKKRY